MDWPYFEGGATISFFSRSNPLSTPLSFDPLRPGLSTQHFIIESEHFRFFCLEGTLILSVQTSGSVFFRSYFNLTIHFTDAPKNHRRSVKIEETKLRSQTLLIYPQKLRLNHRRSGKFSTENTVYNSASLNKYDSCGSLLHEIFSKVLQV